MLFFKQCFLLVVRALLVLTAVYVIYLFCYKEGKQGIGGITHEIPVNTYPSDEHTN